MIRRAIRMVAIAVALAAVSGARQAAAEPVNILGGPIEYSRQNQAYFDLALVDGWMRGEFGDQVSESWDPSHACFPCTPGSTIDVSQTENIVQSDTISAGGVLLYAASSITSRA